MGDMDTRSSKSRSLRILLVIAGALGATFVAALVTTNTATAAPIRSTFRTYYAGPAMNVVRGSGWLLKCSGGMSMTGSVTQYYRDVHADCPGGTPWPTYEECVVDGFPGPCP